MSLLISKVLGTIFFTIVVYLAGKFGLVGRAWNKFTPQSWRF